MIVHRLVGGFLAAGSFILLGLVMATRGSSTLGIDVMDRLGLWFVLIFLAAQFLVCLFFLKPGELTVPLLLFVGGTILFTFFGGSGGKGPVPLHHALFAGASFSGLAAGILAMLGHGYESEVDESD